MRTILLNLLLISSFSLFAQTNTSDQLRTKADAIAAKVTEAMTTELGLTTEQRAQVADMNLRHTRALMDVERVTDPVSRDRRAKLLAEDHHRALQAVLTKAQQEKLEAMHARLEELYRPK